MGALGSKLHRLRYSRGNYRCYTPTENVYMAFLLFVFIVVLFPATGNGATATISLDAHNLEKSMVSSVKHLLAVCH